MARCTTRHLLLLFGLLAGLGAPAGAADVRGRVVMPDTCAPSISPAVVILEPSDPGPAPDPATDAVPSRMGLVQQRGLQFEPRVQVARVGQPIRFTNQDGEPHNVHSATPGVSFSWSMAPNATQEFTPDRPGLIRLVCDIHGHMRGYVVATASPWAKVCPPGGNFGFRDVPDGRYTLRVWHEMGPAVERAVTVGPDAIDLGRIALQADATPAPAGAMAAPVVAWPEVVDRISVLLGESRAAAVRSGPENLARARKLAEDAYFGEFELSDMETAVRRHLGYDRAGAIEARLRGYRAAVRAVHDGKADEATLRLDLANLLLDLNRAAEDLKRLSICDRRDVGRPTAVAESAAPGPVASADGDRQVAALAASLGEVRRLADAGQAGDAASAVTDAYFNDFEPIERLLTARAPQAVAPLEARFNALRGRVEQGASGAELAGMIDGLRGAVDAEVAKADAALAGSFGLAFGASLLTILREGVEVILLLTMLLALAGKAGQPRALAAIWWGIGVAVVASLLTAVGLNSLVASAQGRTREMIEGAVMLGASAILFYVSYWLISQTQAKRWADFLREQARHGATAGGIGTLALTSFLAVYREGAETALMYQAMIGVQGGSRDGLLGIVAGLGLGLVLLAVVVVLFRASSVRLPMRPFFKGTGFALFAMAVVFAGNGVFELQNAGYIRVTPVAWVGLGVPFLGVHPSLQTLIVQGILLLGAAATLVLPFFDRPAAPTEPRPPSASGPGHAPVDRDQPRSLPARDERQSRPRFA